MTQYDWLSTPILMFPVHLTRLTELLEPRSLMSDQGQLLSASPSLELALSLQSSDVRQRPLDVNQSSSRMIPSKFSTSAPLVFSEPFAYVICVANV